MVFTFTSGTTATGSMRAREWMKLLKDDSLENVWECRNGISCTYILVFFACRFKVHFSGLLDTNYLFLSTLTSASIVRKDSPSAAHFRSSISFFDLVKKLQRINMNDSKWSSQKRHQILLFFPLTIVLGCEEWLPVPWWESKKPTERTEKLVDITN